VRDRLLYVVLLELEMFFIQAGNEPVQRVGYGNRYKDEIGVDSKVAARFYRVG
jgi:hypothetical protein